MQFERKVSPKPDLLLYIYYTTNFNKNKTFIINQQIIFYYISLFYDIL